MRAGTQLGPYEIVEQLGAGGMGVVWLATDTRLNRQVAVKVLPPGFAADPERVARFQQEARAAAALNHLNIATVHDVGEDAGVHFIVMEVVRGESLRALVARGPLPVARALEIARGVAAGLARAHRHGVIHRDLKPDNIVLTDDGEPKILDFGLGKLVQEDSIPEAADTQLPTATAGDYAREGSPQVTREGEVVGTLAYMSPEQLLARAVDARSDVFSFGVTLYEMLAGGRPFAGKSKIETMASILRDVPDSLTTTRPDVPDELLAVVDRCLQKEPARRYVSGQELLDALTPLVTGPAVSAAARGRAPGSTWVRAASAVLVLGLVGAVGWLGLRARETARVRNELLPEVQRLADDGDHDGAMRLLREAAATIPDDPRLEQLVTSALMPTTFESDPPGADVYIKGYTAVDRPWISLGKTPLVDVPVAEPYRVRIEAEGYAPFEGGLFTGPVNVELHPPADVPPGMVRVPAGSVSFGEAGPVDLGPFWIDRYEVTNEQYQAFVDDGGYRRRELWPQTFRSGEGELTWEQAAARFVDSTGRPGPAGWELGAYPEGTAQHPVSGISWHEADAFARWAGKSLPTVFHWRQAALRTSIWSQILLLSNFSGEGPAPVGGYAGIGPVGTYDMAGNVGEWCLNASGVNRYVLGGAWSEPSYRFYETESAADPMNRALRFGMRLMQTDEALSEVATGPIEATVYDLRQERPIDDARFEIVRGMYAYDSTPLDSEVEEVREHDHWREEIVTLRAAYGEERVPVHVYLPANVPPPYQAVVFMPGSDARVLTDSTNLRLTFADFIPRSGRALVYPVYKGTYERQVSATGANAQRDLYVQINKDLRRTVDYLETRGDIDVDRLAYYGLSWGSTYGPLNMAIEDRFAAGVLLAGGLYRYPPDRPAESLPVNFAPRVTVPVLMINARDDFALRIDNNVRSLLELLGTPEPDKRLVLIDGGHVPESPNLFIREALDWLDRYLGPIGVE